ncbi:MAG: hypothetical protein JNM80_14465 [Phycisphaerae bacterium]|nr:hypothetical protein [Phycisphaerae bacterium]
MRILAAIAVLLVTRAPVYAQVAPLVRVVETQPSDRGVFKPGQPVVRRVLIENVSAHHVSVRVVGTSCPCTVARLDGNVIPPAESVGLTLRTTAAHVAIPQAYTAVIEARASGEAEPGSTAQTVRVSIEYAPDIEAVAWPVIVRVASPLGQIPEAAFFIRRPDGMRPRLSSVTPRQPWCAVGAVEPVAGCDSAVRVVLKLADRPVGLHRGSVEFQVEGDAGQPQRVSIAWTVQPWLMPSPAGFVAVRRADGWQLEHTELLLRPCSPDLAFAGPLRARVADARAPIDIETPVALDTGGWVLRATARPRIADAPSGETRVLVLGADGAILTEIPVLWLSLPTPTDPAR